MEKVLNPTRLLLGAVALLTLIVVPVALAATDAGPQATASGIKQKVKKLTQQVQQLQQQLDALTSQPGPQGPGGPQGPVGPAGPQGLTGPSTGPAGGDLTGNYPNPDIAAGAVGTNEVGADVLTGGDINESTLGQVPSAGSAGSVANLTIVDRVGNAVAFGNQDANNGTWLSGSSLAQCLPGETLVGGGGNWDDGQQAANEALALTDSHLEGSNSWRATAISDADNDTFRAHVLCFQGG